ncbi:MAG: hypothetical protein MHMPM18_003055 [Marteilia pararefringens]
MKITIDDSRTIYYGHLSKELTAEFLKFQSKGTLLAKMSKSKPNHLVLVVKISDTENKKLLMEDEFKGIENIPAQVTRMIENSSLKDMNLEMPKCIYLYPSDDCELKDEENEGYVLIAEDKSDSDIIHVMDKDFKLQQAKSKEMLNYNEKMAESLAKNNITKVRTRATNVKRTSRRTSRNSMDSDQEFRSSMQLPFKVVALMNRVVNAYDKHALSFETGDVIVVDSFIDSNSVTGTNLRTKMSGSFTLSMTKNQ